MKTEERVLFDALNPKQVYENKDNLIKIVQNKFIKNIEEDWDKVIETCKVNETEFFRALGEVSEDDRMSYLLNNMGENEHTSLKEGLQQINTKSAIITDTAFIATHHFPRIVELMFEYTQGGPGKEKARSDLIEHAKLDSEFLKIVSDVTLICIGYEKKI